MHVPAGLAHLVRSAWQGGGDVSGLSAMFWEPGRAQVAAAADQAADGDFGGGGGGLHGQRTRANAKTRLSVLGKSRAASKVDPCPK